MKRSITLALAILIAVLFLSVPVQPALAQATTNGNDIIDNIIRSSVLTIRTYDAGGVIIKEGIGLMVFDESTLAAPCSLLEGVDGILAIDQSGTEYDMTQALAVDKNRGVVLLAFDSPTNLTPVSLSKEPGSLQMIVGWTEDSYFLDRVMSMSKSEKEGDLSLRFAMPGDYGDCTGGMLVDFFGATFDINGLITGYDSESGKYMVLMSDELLKMQEENTGATVRPLEEVMAGK